MLSVSVAVVQTAAPLATIVFAYTACAPMPPVTSRAWPLFVFTLIVELLIDRAWVVVAPRPVTVCSVLMSLIVTEPVIALNVISVPLLRFVTPKLVKITVPVDVLTPKYVDPCAAVTPVLVIVISPVEVLTDIPVPGLILVTPALIRVL